MAFDSQEIKRIIYLLIYLLIWATYMLLCR